MDKAVCGDLFGAGPLFFRNQMIRSADGIWQYPGGVFPRTAEKSGQERRSL